jgi:flagellar biosynthesis component FlhA
VQKPLPADDRAVNCIGLKRDAIYSFLDFDYISNDKSRWIDFANFIGEIRSQIIPNYTNQSEMISVLAISPSAKQQLQKELEENERKAITDRLQLELRSTNRELTKYLVRNIPSRLHKDAEFIVAVSAAARLSKEEANELKGKID